MPRTNTLAYFAALSIMTFDKIGTRTLGFSALLMTSSEDIVTMATGRLKPTK
jgi:hypothetical protein